MNLVSLYGLDPDTGIPRVSGGEPIDIMSIYNVSWYSPRERG